MFIESLDVFAVHLVDEVGAAVVNRLGSDAAGAQVSEKLMYERQQLRRLRRAAVFFCQLHHVCLPFVVGNKNFFDFIYGAQNEAYMSRSAEKWVRGLCFNELGVCS